MCAWAIAEVRKRGTTRARSACGTQSPQKLRHDAVGARREHGKYRARALRHEPMEVLRKPDKQLALLQQLTAELRQRGAVRRCLWRVPLSHTRLHPEAGHDEHEVGVPEEEDVLRVAAGGRKACAPE